MDPRDLISKGISCREDIEKLEKALPKPWSVEDSIASSRVARQKKNIKFAAQAANRAAIRTAIKTVGRRRMISRLARSAGKAVPLVGAAGYAGYKGVRYLKDKLTGGKKTEYEGCEDYSGAMMMAPGLTIPARFVAARIGDAKREWKKLKQLASGEKKTSILAPTVIAILMAYGLYKRGEVGKLKAMLKDIISQKKEGK